MQLIDLSHAIESGMTTYPGLPAPTITEFLSRQDSRAKYDGRAEFQIGRIEMVANTGTYLDAPSHRYADGGDLSALLLPKLAGVPGVLIDARGGGRAVDENRLRGIDIAGRAVLILTGWSGHWRTDHYGAAGHPYVTAPAAEHLANRGAVIVGIDSVNIDDMADKSRPVHTVLLRHGIPIVEHLTNLDQLTDRDFTFFAVPPKVRGMGTFPVRAFAMVG